MSGLRLLLLELGRKLLSKLGTSLWKEFQKYLAKRKTAKEGTARANAKTDITQAIYLIEQEIEKRKAVNEPFEDLLIRITELEEKLREVSARIDSNFP